MIGLRVRTFRTVHDRVRQVFGGTGTEQALRDAVLGFDRPRNIEYIVDDTVIGEWHSGFESVLHGRAIHPVEECLHEPADIQIGNLAFLRIEWRFLRQDIDFGECCAVCSGDIFFHLHAGGKFRMEQGFAEGDVHRPWEGG